MVGNLIHILLVEDDKEDVVLINKALKKSKLVLQMDVVKDGQECMDYLRRTGQYKNASKPDVILLDLNMPRKDGREVLLEMKADQYLKKIPVVILTTSEAEIDINKTYEIGANCYIAKPVDFIQFQKVVNEIAHFWFTVVKLPDGKY